MNPDAVVAMDGGKITHFGAASQVLASLPPDMPVHATGKDTLILPGFIDAHVHYPQTQIIGSHGEQLLDWLEKYTFVAEQALHPANTRAKWPGCSCRNACVPAPPPRPCSAPCIRNRWTRFSKKRRRATCA